MIQRIEELKREFGSLHKLLKEAEPQSPFYNTVKSEMNKVKGELIRLMSYNSRML